MFVIAYTISVSLVRTTIREFVEKSVCKTLVEVSLSNMRPQVLDRRRLADRDIRLQRVDAVVAVIASHRNLVGVLEMFVSCDEICQVHGDLDCQVVVMRSAFARRSSRASLRAWS